MTDKEKKIREELEVILAQYYLNPKVSLIRTIKKIEKLFNGEANRSEEYVCLNKCGDTQPYNDICLNCGSSIIDNTSISL